MNGIDYIEENYEVDEEFIIVTHDAVRPFLSPRVIDEKILNLPKNMMPVTQ